MNIEEPLFNRPIKKEKPNQDSDEQIILTREKSSSSRLNGNNANQTVFVSLTDDGSIIFKPIEGETHLRAYNPEGTYYVRERAAYVVSEMLGFHIVPTTVIREIDGKYGSAQRFIPDVKTGLQYEFDTNLKSFLNRAPDLQTAPAPDYSEAQKTFSSGFLAQTNKLSPYSIDESSGPEINISSEPLNSQNNNSNEDDFMPTDYWYEEELKKMWLFDLIIYNSDRHSGNFLVDEKNKKVIPIDHGLTFAPDYLKTYGYFADEDIPQEIIDSLVTFGQDQQKINELHEELSGLISFKELTTFFSRLDIITQSLKREGKISPHIAAMIRNFEQ